jgi:hypothetical protein
MKLSQKCITLLALASCLTTVTTTAAPTPEAKEKHHVYLLIGQSNMAGRAAIPPKDMAPLPNAWLLTKDGTWEAAKPPLNIHSTINKGPGMQKLNPGTQFAADMLAEHPGTTIGLVVNARGGSKIEQWIPSEKYYKEALRRTRQAMKSGTLKGILWHQGESNHSDTDYLVKLKALVNNLRSDLDDPKLPFVVGQINSSKKKYPVNEQLLKLPTQLKATACISSRGLTTTDAWHFDATSQKLLGERYAKAMISLQKGNR